MRGTRPPITQSEHVSPPSSPNPRSFQLSELSEPLRQELLLHGGVTGLDANGIRYSAILHVDGAVLIICHGLPLPHATISVLWGMDHEPEGITWGPANIIYGGSRPEGREP